MEEIINYKDLKKLIDFLNDDYSEKKESEITHFFLCNQVYKYTNETMELYPKSNLSGKKILTITSSGDHLLDGILKGATDIDSIDINIFSKYYAALKIAMIKAYDYKDFFRKINIFTLEIAEPSKISILENISKYLTFEENLFWEIYLRYKNGLCPDFFYKYPFHGDYNQYHQKDKFYELKEKLDDVNIRYYDGDIIDINKILIDRKYDFIYLSNILERIYKMESMAELIDSLIKHLNKNGIIYNYYLGLDCIEMIDKFGVLKERVQEKFDFKYYCDYGDEKTCDAGVLEMTLK